MKRLDKQDGSIFIIVLLSFSLLMILGASLISMTTMNFKINNIDQDVKSTYYYTEAGLDQVYLLVSKKIKEAFNYAKKKTIDSVKLEVLDTEGNVKNEYVLNGNIDMAKLQAYEDLQFDTYYKEFFKSELNNDFVNYLEDPNNIKTIQGQISKPIIDVIEKKIETFETNPLDRLIIPVSVSYEDTQKKMKRTLKADIKVIVPNFNFPLYIKEDNVADNKMYTQTIVGKDVSVHNGAKVTINGNLYAKGTKASDDWIGSANASKGIYVNTGTLTIYGDIYTGSYLQTEGYNSNINVINGEVYAFDIATQANTYNTQITLSNSNAYVVDDLDLNGRKAKIDINGNYYGMSDGSGFSSSHFNNSAIIIEALDLGNGSSLSMRNGELYLGGVVYWATDSTGGKFQTGVSVSIKNNITTAFCKSPEVLRPYLTTLKDANIFASYNPRYFVKYTDGTLLNLNELKEYFKAYYDYDKDNSLNSLDMGQAGIDIKSNLYYSSGYCLYDGKLNIGLRNEEERLNKINPIKDKFYWYSNAFVGSKAEFENRLTDEEKNNPTLYKQIIDELEKNGPYNFYMNSKPTLEQKSTISTEINTAFGSKGILNEEGQDYILFYNDRNDEEIRIVKGSESKIVGNTIYHTGSLDGLIVSNGKVIIDGSLNMNGAIISKSDVQFVNGTVDMNHSKLAMGYVLDKCPSARQILFRHNRGYFSVSKPVFEDDNNIDYMIEQVISYNNWDVE